MCGFVPAPAELRVVRVCDKGGRGGGDRAGSEIDGETNCKTLMGTAVTNGLTVVNFY